MSHTIYRNDYHVPTHLIETVKLAFDLDPESTSVTNIMHVCPNPACDPKNFTLELVGESIELVSVAINGVTLEESQYTLTDKSLTLPGISRECDITIVNRFSPRANTALSGIYCSGDNLMSQCEAEGFRRITYYLDRPDVLARYHVTIRAPKDLYPVLLSNGNLISETDSDDGRHTAVWEDPFPKASYLFALVAGKLVAREETMRLKNGKNVLLQVWTEPQNKDRTQHTMASLKKAILWDETRWGLELDLERFMIVATDDFNFGAMENKGLNIFNSKYVLATPDMATDSDYAAIESVVGHEYFHNWTGDRVTLRDWFQLTLKEGLTVFRDQEFSMDMMGEASARAVARIKDVKALRSAQFPEDTGPMAHPIRPESYQEVNNFYTMTVYEKGAEVIRMLQTLLGKDVFRKGFDHYIATHDGKAVTCDDFIASMAKASARDLSQFSLWYSQAGTPRVSVTTQWDDDAHTLTLVATQTTPTTPGQAVKRPMLIPLAVGLLDAEGHDMPLEFLDEDDPQGHTTRMLELTQERNQWVFAGLKEKPIISLGRGFSAPIIIDYPYTREELAFLARHDSDPFNRWEAMQRLMMAVLNDQIRSIQTGQPINMDMQFMRAFEEMLLDTSLSPAFRAVALEFPSERLIADAQAMIEPQSIHTARETMIRTVGTRYSREFLELFDKLQVTGEYSPESEAAGKRALKNLALNYLLASGLPRAVIMLRDQFATANNLTDRLAALTILANSPSPAKEAVLVEAAEAWQNEPLLINKWLTVLATASTQQGETPAVNRVRELMDCGLFNIRNPNNCYALLIAFCNANPTGFHQPSGEGYQFWAQMVITLNDINPHVAARLARALDHWRRYTPQQARMMYEALQFVAKRDLSPSVREVIEKALHNPV